MAKNGVKSNEVVWQANTVFKNSFSSIRKNFSYFLYFSQQKNFLLRFGFSLKMFAKQPAFGNTQNVDRNNKFRIGLLIGMNLIAD
ncbi:hypothetical protein ACFSPU_12580 [Haoranjiania flava]|uniref:Uncharacterized protein n=1 Tax=Haoranjiania flava TaxID=1856322 RepID=A0AAE3LL00_9BACT|nr:hypothetical protein [Haoranjiania flava]MCU7695487.1 hypothetical protein [Haoranjiania flava]